MDAGGFQELAHLLEYPGEDYRARVERYAAALQAGCPAAAGALSLLSRQLADLAPDQLQEHFTAAFDLDPGCCLEVGWHLFGEDYERGTFLAAMRAELREHGVPEDGELPDHLRCLLPLLDREAPAQAATLAESAILPALEAIRAGLAKKQSPFEPLACAAERLVEAAHGRRPGETDEARRAAEGGSP